MEWIVQLPVLFFSVMFHEVAHGWIALRNGDDTAKRHGRLTFNPLRHVDPLGTIVLPLFCLLAHLTPVGWAKPVPIDPRRLGSRWALVRVTMVGPLSNILLSAAAALAFKFTLRLPVFVPLDKAILRNAFIFAVQINLFLAFFNLIPIHPLDGSGALAEFLPRSAKRVYQRHFPYGFILIWVMISYGAMRPLVMIPSALVFSAFGKLGLLW